MKKKLGLTFGTFMGLWHLCWSVLVALGIAQTVLDWAMGLHFINNPVRIGTFRLLTALELVGTSIVFGYVVGWVIGFLWEHIHEERKHERVHAAAHTAAVH